MALNSLVCAEVPLRNCSQTEYQSTRGMLCTVYFLHQ